MRYISILALIVLTSCNLWQKDEQEIKKIGHDAVDETVESLERQQK